MNKTVAFIGLGIIPCIIAPAFAEDTHLSLTKQSVACIHEITAALDKVSGGEVAHLLRDMAKSRGTPILMVTHDPRILDIADRIVTMEDGRIVESVAAS